MRYISLLYGLASSLVVGGGWISPVTAEIVPDSTLPQPSKVTQSGNRTVITEGTRRGRNLFHSFQEFSIGSGQEASFQTPESGIANIFTRITGRNPSRINGLIEAVVDNHISPANLFLLNPNGIIFGENASLRIGGSFIATTANSIQFEDGILFSAVSPQVTPLLTVSLPVGLQFGSSPGQIVNRSFAENSASNALGQPILGLVGSPNRTFALVGGDVVLNGGGIIAESGRIEIGSVAGTNQLTLIPTSTGWELGYEGVDSFGNIRLLNESEINTIGERGGAIQLQGRNIKLRGRSFASTTSTNSTQASGTLKVTATDSIVIEEGSSLGAFTYTLGRGGNIILSTQRLDLLTGGLVGSKTYHEGQGGNVRIHASESVRLTGIAPEDLNRPDQPRQSTLYSQSEGVGNAGDLYIQTNHLQVQSGGQISTTIFGQGNAGSLTIRAHDIELTGIAFDPTNGQPLVFNGLPISGGLFVGTEQGSSGNGGTLSITAQRISIQDGALLQANTYGSGNAGNVDVLAAESIEVSGISEQGGLPARITATSGGLPEFSQSLARTATGRGGNLNLRTNRLTVQNGGVIAVNSRNRRAAGAGNINIRSNQIVLDSQAQLNAQTESGDGAGIQLSGVELLTLRRNSEISTSAGLNSGGGNGGDINIDADFILNAPRENSDINADAGQGNGGNITINAQGILGITEQNQRTPQSDITASSESGVDGEISISNPTIDPTRGIVELPSTIVDASQLIAQGCRAGNREVTDALGEFVITGRGGLPPSPDDLGSSSAVITDWAELDTQPDQQGLELGSPVGERTSGVTQPEMAQSGVTQSIVEAQGWIMGQNGKVALVANAPTVTPHLPNWTVPYCTSESLQNNELHESVPDSTRYETIEPVAIEGSIVP